MHLIFALEPRILNHRKSNIITYFPILKLLPLPIITFHNSTIVVSICSSPPAKTPTVMSYFKTFSLDFLWWMIESTRGGLNCLLLPFIALIKIHLFCDDPDVPF